MIIFHWLLSLVCLVGLIGIIVFPILAVINAIKESSKQLVQGQKRYSKAIKFVILTVISFFALVLALVGYGVLNYVFTIIGGNF